MARPWQYILSRHGNKVQNFGLLLNEIQKIWKLDLMSFKYVVLKRLYISFLKSTRILLNITDE